MVFVFPCNIQDVMSSTNIYLECLRMCYQTVVCVTNASGTVAVCVRNEKEVKEELNK
jgi:hypothetical protein